MNLLTATARTQGQRESDFNACVEGELVIPPARVCAKDRDDPDGPCGCGRSFAGLSSHRATTTAMVRDLPGFTRAYLVEALQSSLDEQGHCTHTVEDLASELIDVATELGTGAVVELRLRWIVVRIDPSDEVHDDDDYAEYDEYDEL